MLRLRTRGTGLALLVNPSGLIGGTAPNASGIGALAPQWAVHHMQGCVPVVRLAGDGQIQPAFYPDVGRVGAAVRAAVMAERKPVIAVLGIEPPGQRELPEVGLALDASALALAMPSAGSSKEARIAMIAMTTNNSISVKPALTAEREDNEGKSEPNIPVLLGVLRSPCPSGPEWESSVHIDTF